MKDINDYNYMGYLFSMGREEEMLGTNKVCPLCRSKLDVIPNSYDNMFYICYNCNIKLSHDLREYEEIDNKRRGR